nr:hypothetical protein BaRGS_024889 [Batillaria attramentaria]
MFWCFAKRAAFRTQLPSAQATIPANAPVRFVEQYDVGGGYDPTTGVYTVPISGVYTFQFQMYPVVVQDLRIDLYGNNHIVVRSGCYDSSATEYTSCASSITVHANAGDKFWLQTTLAGDYFDGYHSFFTGAMISADP